MKKESSTNLQKYSGIAEQMVKMSSDCPEITKMILDIIYGDEGEGNRISTISQTAQRLRNPGQKRLRKACTYIKKDLNEEEKEIFDKVIKAMNTKSITVNMLNLAFAVILLYVCFTILPLWAAISLIGIKLAIPIAELVKYIIIAKKLIKDDKDANKKILSIRLKLANLKK